MGITWRKFYAPKIANIIKEGRGLGKTDKEIKWFLAKNNPGEYGHMKKIWSDESLKQLGLKKKKQIIENTNQEALF